MNKIHYMTEGSFPKTYYNPQCVYMVCTMPYPYKYVTFRLNTNSITRFDNLDFYFLNKYFPTDFFENAEIINIFLNEN